MKATEKNDRYLKLIEFYLVQTPSLKKFLHETVKVVVSQNERFASAPSFALLSLLEPSSRDFGRLRP
ncbi:hypothetical protein CCP2SC5_1720004 [Azospirillaceae bacterium]